MSVTNNSAPSYIHTGPGYHNASFTTATALDDRVYPYPGPGRPGRLSALSVSLCKLVFYGTFVWACRALKCQNWWFLARADRRGPDRRRDHGVPLSANLDTWHSKRLRSTGHPLIYSPTTGGRHQRRGHARPHGVLHRRVPSHRPDEPRPGGARPQRKVTPPLIQPSIQPLHAIRE